MINRNRYAIHNTKKILHKVGKHWVVVSVLALAMLGGISAPAVTHANAASTNQVTVNRQVGDHASAAAAAPLVKSHPSSESAQSSSASVAPGHQIGDSLDIMTSQLRSISASVSTADWSYSNPQNTSGNDKLLIYKASSANGWGDDPAFASDSNGFSGDDSNEQSEFSALNGFANQFYADKGMSDVKSASSEYRLYSSEAGQFASTASLLNSEISHLNDDVKQAEMTIIFYSDQKNDISDDHDQLKIFDKKTGSQATQILQNLNQYLPSGYVQDSSKTGSQAASALNTVQSLTSQTENHTLANPGKYVPDNQVKIALEPQHLSDTIEYVDGNQSVGSEILSNYDGNTYRGAQDIQLYDIVASALKDNDSQFLIDQFKLPQGYALSDDAYNQFKSQVSDNGNYGGVTIKIPVWNKAKTQSTINIVYKYNDQTLPGGYQESGDVDTPVDDSLIDDVISRIPEGYAFSKIVNNVTQFPDRGKTASIVISVKPIEETDTINFYHGKKLISTKTYQGDEGTNFDVKKDLPSPYNEADHTAFTYDGKTHDVQLGINGAMGYQPSPTKPVNPSDPITPSNAIRPNGYQPVKPHMNPVRPNGYIPKIPEMDMVDTINFYHGKKLVGTKKYQGQQGTLFLVKDSDLPDGYNVVDKFIFTYDNQVHNVQVGIDRSNDYTPVKPERYELDYHR